MLCKCSGKYIDIYFILKITCSHIKVGSPFLSILTEFLSNRFQRVVVDGQSNKYYRNVILDVLGSLLFILYTHDMWFGLENMLVSCADDATLVALIPSPNMRSNVTE